MKEEKKYQLDPTLETKKYTSTDGTVRYMKDGKLHNWEGPAVIHPNGKKEYYINGFQHDKDSHHKAKRDGVGLPWFKSSVGKGSRS
jgi:hypothetical protein